MPQTVSLESIESLATNTSNGRMAHLRSIKPGSAMVFTETEEGVDSERIRSRLGSLVRHRNFELASEGKRLVTRKVEGGVAVFLQDIPR
jgi:hypothetical protein